VPSLILGPHNVSEINDRRDNTDIKLILAEVITQGKDCHDQYAALSGKFDKVITQQAVFATNIAGIHSQLGEIKTDIKPMPAQLATHKALIDSMSGSSVQSFWQTGNAKLLILGSIAIIGALVGINIKDIY